MKIAQFDINTIKRNCKNMRFLVIDRMLDRAKIAKNSSDTDYFLNLMYLGEMIVKIVTLGLVTAVDNDNERLQYVQEHRLIRANGIGEWVAVIEEIVLGPTRNYMINEIQDVTKAMTMKCKENTWQYDCVKRLFLALDVVENSRESVPSSLNLIRWFSKFTKLRNATRGHGATFDNQCTKMCVHLENSLALVIENFNLFQIPWCYLYRNLSGKYRVTNYIENTDVFDFLKNSQIRNQQKKYDDGIYIYYDQPRRVNLLFSDVEATDFYFPNGNFNDKTKTYEVLSYLTNTKHSENGDHYLMPTSALPNSETQGRSIDIQGNSLGNIPPVQKGYIKRTELENELHKILIDDRHSIVTLFGRGGIGKTWLALEILHKIAEEGKFSYVLWFSARDIDLLIDGPKTVKAHVQSIKEIATEFVNLYLDEEKEGDILPEDFMALKMQKNEKGSILFVFDNFETVKSPNELYNWIDTYIRLPNKVLITSRIRDFKGDFPIEVFGMNDNECKMLIDRTVNELQIESLISSTYIQELTDKSFGHPYVIKILLGEVAKTKKAGKIDKIIASVDTILNALFERTFESLSPAAKRVYLTLCSWRSPISLLALEAVLLRHDNESMDINNAVKELQYSSFIESNNVENEEDQYLSIPLVAFEFGKKKLLTYPYKAAIDADTEILRLFGATQQTNIDSGFKPKIERLISNIRNRINDKDDLLSFYAPILEYIASKYSYAWLLLGDLYQDYNLLNESIASFNRYIETGEISENILLKVWSRLAEAYRENREYEKEIHALVEKCQIKNVSFFIISESVNKINLILSSSDNVMSQDEKRIITMKLIKTMEGRINEANANDCSRLAWLYLRLNDPIKAREIANMGLAIDNGNVHCKNIIERLDSRALMGFNNKCEY